MEGTTQVGARVPKSDARGSQACVARMPEFGQHRVSSRHSDNSAAPQVRSQPRKDPTNSAFAGANEIPGHVKITMPTTRRAGHCKYERLRIKVVIQRISGQAAPQVPARTHNNPSLAATSCRPSVCGFR